MSLAAYGIEGDCLREEEISIADREVFACGFAVTECGLNGGSIWGNHAPQSHTISPNPATELFWNNGSLMMPGTNLQHFLGGGILPFTGRTREIDRILDFWEKSPETNGLRTGLITAEAGSGKSRLMEESIRRVAAKEGAVVHAKLRPEGIASIGALLAPALWGSDSAGMLLKREPQPTLSSVVAALRRVAGLRRTLLVIEDIHLLEGTAANEFSLLLETLADDPIALLCTTRPAPLAVRESLSPFLRLELRLPLLSPDNLSLLWEALFTLPPDPETLDVLWNATLGNPLAIRSALRGAVNSGVLLPDPVYGAKAAPGAFADVIRRSVERLTQGMIAHLNEDEHRAAGRLASLGESFAVEGASVLLGERAGELIERLREEGILIGSGTASVSLNGRISAAEPMAFSHSLLHNVLTAGGRIEPEEFLPLILEDVPLYSLLPYQILSRCRTLPPMETAQVSAAVERLRDTAVILNRTSDWPYALTLHDAGKAIWSSFSWPDEQKKLAIGLMLAMTKINLVRQRNAAEEYHDLVEYCMETSERLLALEASFCRYRLYAFTFRQEYLFHKGDEAHWSIWNDVQDFLRDYPDLRFDEAYVEFLREAFHFAGSLENKGRIRLIEQELMAILESEKTDPKIRDMARLNVGKYLLMSFETAEDVERRETLLAELEELDGGDLRRRPWTVEYFFRTGRTRRTIEECERILPYFRETSLQQSYHSALLLKLAAMTLEGYPTERILEIWSTDRKRNWAEGKIPQRMIRHVAHSLYVAFLLRGDGAGVHRIIETSDVSQEDITLWNRVLLAEIDGELAPFLEKELNGTPQETTEEKEGTERVREKAIERFMRELFGNGELSAEGLDAATDAIRPAPIEIHDIPLLSAFLVLAERGASEENVLLSDFIEGVLYPATIEALRWMTAHGIESGIPTLLRRAGFLLSPEEKGEWDREGTEKQEEELKPQEEAKSLPDLQITMFGIMTARPKEGDQVRIRGGRNQTLLGTLVADQLIPEPLDRMDFMALATGDIDDPDKARRSMNVAVLRLREVIGREAILTDGDTPRLNREYASVDLLEAYEALRQARRSLREENLFSARTGLMRAVRLWKGEVPFPGLYADLFEELREEFETRIRNGIIAVGKRLLKAEDNGAAEELLAEAFAILPEDEEIGELLRQALDRLGKLADSQWVAIKVAEEL